MLVGAVGIELKSCLSARHFLIPLNAQESRNARPAEGVRNSEQLGSFPALCRRANIVCSCESSREPKANEGRVEATA